MIERYKNWVYWWGKCKLCDRWTKRIYVQRYGIAEYYAENGLFDFIDEIARRINDNKVIPVCPECMSDTVTDRIAEEAENDREDKVLP